MKRLKAIFLTLISFLCLATLASCGKKAKIEVINISSMRTRIGVTIKIDDPKSYITASSVVATLYETDDDGDSVGTLTFDALEEDEQTKTFDDLLKETTYKLVIKATVDDKSVTYYNKKVSTTNEGSSADNPIHITSIDEFKAITYDDDAYYSLDKDLDYTAENGEKQTLETMFDASNQFTGHLNGNGHKIKGFKISNAKVYSGIFGYIGVGASIENLVIEDAELSSTKGAYLYAGILAGCNQGTINNVTAKTISIEHLGSSTSQAFVGGLVGVNCYKLTNSSITDVTINARTRKQNFIGGLVGSNGGIIQATINGAVIDNCFVKNANITNTFVSVQAVDKKTSSSPYFLSYTGGLVGETSVDISNSYVDSVINATASFSKGSTLKMYEIAVGGFAGRIINVSKVENSVSKSTITSSTADAYTFYTGVFAGEVLDSIVKNSVGVLAGENSVADSADYSTVEDQDIVKLYAKNFSGFGLVKNIMTTENAKIENSGYMLAADATIKADTAEDEIGRLSLADAVITSYDSSSLNDDVKAFFNSIFA